MRIVSWNINSLRKRLPQLIDLLKRDKPDLLCLQETKVDDSLFPRMEIEAEGYYVEAHGQKAYNGVALLSRTPLKEVRRGLGGVDDQARYIEAQPEGLLSLRAACLYAPNGNPPESEKFAYKQEWMRRFCAHASALLAREEILVLAGDYNVIPAPEDVYDPAAFEGDALVRPETRAAFRQLLNMGFTDALRALKPKERLWTFWDYQRGAFGKDEGLRIDHFLLSPRAADRLRGAGVDKARRAEAEPSDHAPVWIDLDL